MRGGLGLTTKVVNVLKKRPERRQPTLSLFQKEQQTREQEESHSAMLARLADRVENALVEPSGEQTTDESGSENPAGIEALQESSTPGKTFTG